MSRIVTGTAIGLVILAACWLAFRHKARQQRAEDAAMFAESVAAALRFNCPVCDDRQPEALCICHGECGRRYCPWTETGMDLAVLADPEAFAEAYADLLAEVNDTEGDVW